MIKKARADEINRQPSKFASEVNEEKCLLVSGIFIHILTRRHSDMLGK